MRSNRALLRWYKIINKRFFNNQLTNNVCVRYADPDEADEIDCEYKEFGSASKASDDYHEYEIVLSKAMNTHLLTKLNTLAHEMIHVATDLKDDHGPAFETWRQYISDRGIFKKNALRKGLTIF